MKKLKKKLTRMASRALEAFRGRGPSRANRRAAGQRALFDEQWYSANNGDLAGLKPLVHYRAKGAGEGRQPSPYFDPTWYQSHFPNVSAKELLTHYVSIGWQQGWSPSAVFSVDYYLRTNPDVAKAKIEPLRHYVEHGWREGRNPHPVVDIRWLMGQASDQRAEPLRSLLTGDLMATPHPLFDTPAYLRARPAATGGAALSDYLTIGWKLGERPSAWFDPLWYVGTYGDVAKSGEEPLTHYLTKGWRDNYQPNPLFEPAEYLRLHPDVAAAGVEPLTHFVQFGRHEGRAPSSVFDPVWFALHYQAATGVYLDPADSLGVYLVDPRAINVSPHPLFDPTWFQGGRATLECGTPLAEYLHRPASGASPHALVDERWYRDTLLSGRVEPALKHYVQYGHTWGWPPNPAFDEGQYKANTGCAIAGAVHYVMSGERAGMRPNRYFSPYYYKSVYAHLDGAEAAPLAHFLRSGDAQGLSPSPEFDAKVYRSRHLSFESETRALHHFMTKGRYEGVDPQAEGGHLTSDRWLAERTEAMGAAPADQVSGLLIVGHGRAGPSAAARRAALLADLPGATFVTAATAESLGELLARAPRAKAILLLEGDALLTATDVAILIAELNAGEGAMSVAPKVVGPARLVVANIAPLTLRAERPLDSGHPDVNVRRVGAALRGPVVLFRRSILLNVVRSAAPGDQIADLVSMAAREGAVYQPKAEAFFSGIPAGRRPDFVPPAAGKRMLYIDSTIPKPDQDAGSDTAARVLKMLRDDGWEITFLPDAQFEHAGRYTQDLQQIGVRPYYAPYVKHSEVFLQGCQEQFDVVFLARIYSGGRHFEEVKRLWPSARVIFNTVDLHYLREQREATLKGDVEGFARSVKVKALELNLIRRSDATIVLSDTERDILTTEKVGKQVVVVPPVFEADKPASYDPKERKDIFFLGGYAHAPNVDAVDFFLREVWPLVIRERDDIIFNIVGANPPERFKAYETANVRLVGFVPDLSQLLDRMRLNVAPLRYGAGVKVKVIAGLASGVPCLATPMAIEGSGVNDGDGVVLVSDAKAFARGILDLYDDMPRLKQLSRNGLDLVGQRYSMKAIKTLYGKLLTPEA